MNVLVTGGAGYIGTHICVELLNKGYCVTVLDDLSNSDQVAIKRVEHICQKEIQFSQTNLLNIEGVRAAFKEYKIDMVIHLAGRKAVGESVLIPLEYYHNNVCGAINLLRVMAEFNVTRFVFSSSATVYGDPESMPIDENAPLFATNPYGRTKLFIEEILRDLSIARENWRIVLLRYFNPIGAHPSGLIGESPLQPPNNLVPIISRVAMGKQEKLKVYGDDYPTPDGTGVRDYIHVVDLARGHISALERLGELEKISCYNLGTGRGYSVFEMIKTYERISGRRIPYEITDRRPGDIAVCYSSPELAKKELGWESQLTLEDMCKDEWNWISNNPNGYC